MPSGSQAATSGGIAQGSTSGGGRYKAEDSYIETETEGLYSAAYIELLALHMRLSRKYHHVYYDVLRDKLAELGTHDLLVPLADPGHLRDIECRINASRASAPAASSSASSRGPPVVGSVRLPPPPLPHFLAPKQPPPPRFLAPEQPPPFLEPEDKDGVINV